MTDTPLNFTPESFIKYHKDKGTLHVRRFDGVTQVSLIDCPREDSAHCCVDRYVLNDLFGDDFIDECDRIVKDWPENDR